MCPTSKYRCGSCLSKWNGNSWEESYKCVLPVKSWSLVLNKKYQLCIEGLCDIDSDLSVCIPITDRLNSYWVSNECTLVKLRGILNTKELPEYVAAKFAHGVPTNWKEIVKKWIQYVQRDEKSSFSWEQDESFGSCDTSVLLTRSRRIISERWKDGNVKGKSTQRTPGESSKNVDDERDSALPTSEDCSAAKNRQPGSPPSIWHSVSPQLPAYKLKQIVQWMDTAHHPSKSLEREVEDSDRDISGEFVAPSEPVFNPKNRVPITETVHRKTNNVAQSTPVAGSGLIVSEGLPSWNVSSVHSTINNSVTLGSVASDLFGKSVSVNQPKKNLKSVSRVPPSNLLSIGKNSEVPGSETSSDRPSSNVVSGSFFRRPRKTATSKNLPKVPRESKNAEVPGSRMGRMLSSSLRPRRKQTLQKIERWRPVLGVDGCLKVQGYLLLQCDMTAGQILTTNTVSSWGERRVVTCDGREYELVGDPYGKIPDDLKNELLKPLDCNDITARLMEFQGLKEDVTSCFYLAPPPAPMTMSMTRSGRVSRPRAPYWLNRSDWGAEYELFYGNDDNENNDGDKTTNRSSRSTQNMRNNRRTTPRNTTLTKQKSKSPASLQDASTCVLETPSTSRLRGSLRKNVGSASTSTGLNSENSPRSQRNTNNTPGSNLSVNNRSSNKVDKNSLNLKCSQEIQERTSGLASVNNNLGVLPNNQQDKENNFIEKSNPDATRSCFENITWKSTQNQMMMPSPRLCADASNVDFSSSRIKVSYITPGNKSSPNNLQNSPEIRSRSPTMNESYSSNECTPKTRPSRSPTKRACLPCLQDSKTRTASHSPHSPLSHTRPQTIPEKTRTQAMTPSPLRIQTETSPPVVPVARSRRRLSLRSSKTPVGKQSPQRSLPSPKRKTSDVTSSAHRNTPGRTPKSPLLPKSLRSTTRTTARQLRVIVRRLDTKKSPQNVRSPSSRRSTSSRSQRRSVAKEKKQATPKSSKRNENKKSVSATKKIQEKKPMEVVNKNKRDEINRNDDVKNKKVTGKNVKNIEVKNVKKVKKIKRNEEKTAKKVEEEKNKKVHPTKTIPNSSEEIEDDGNASDSSSDSSVGPSASVIFQLNDAPVTRRKPRTLKERRERDAQLAEMGRKLAAKAPVGIDADDDPMANLIASHKFSALPQEWCRHENFLGKSRKRRRPSSSDGTVSPSRSGLDDGFGNEDATSSVATPQLLMRPPDPKQVQSYLQRQRAWNAKPQRPTRQSKRNNDNLMLPHIDYAAVFRPEISDSEECASEVSVSNSDWDA